MRLLDVLQLAFRHFSEGNSMLVGAFISGLQPVLLNSEKLMLRTSLYLEEDFLPWCLVPGSLYSHPFLSFFSRALDYL